MNVKQEFLKTAQAKGAEWELSISNRYEDKPTLILDIWADDRQFSEGLPWEDEEDLLEMGLSFLNEVELDEWKL